MYCEKILQIPKTGLIPHFWPFAALLSPTCFFKAQLLLNIPTYKFKLGFNLY